MLIPYDKNFPVIITPNINYIVWPTTGTIQASQAATWNLQTPPLFNGYQFDWAVKHQVTPPPSSIGIYSNWTIAEALGFGGYIFYWGGNGQFNANGGLQGTGSPFVPSRGPLQLVMDGKSSTNGVVQAYSDGFINVSSFPVSSQFPIQTACIGILKQTGTIGKPYLLQVIQGGELLFTIRSVIWGTIKNLQEDATNVELIDNQWVNSIAALGD